MNKGHFRGFDEGERGQDWVSPEDALWSWLRRVWSLV